MSDKFLDRLSKVLHQAENASTPEEAETYMEKARAMAAANSIDLALARAHQADKTKRETAETRKVETSPYSYRQTPNQKWLKELFVRIAEANDLKCAIGTRTPYVWVTGFPSDMEVAERVYASLAVQMVSEADAAIKRGDNKAWREVPKQIRVAIPEDERAWGEWIEDGSWNSNRYYASCQKEHDDWPQRYPLPPKTRLETVRCDNGDIVYEKKEVSTVDGRVWRANFYEGFISRVTSRLWEAKRKAIKEAEAREGKAEGESTETGLVLRSKAREVEEAWESEYGEGGRKLTGTYSGPETTRYNDNAQAAGQAAGARAKMGTDIEMAGSNRKEIG